MAKPMIAIGTPTRNTVSIERANASTTSARTSGGRLRIAAGLPLSVSGETPAGSCPPGRRSARLDASWFVSTAPSSATPKEPPIERRNVAAPVAVPRSLLVDRVLHRQDEHLHHHAEAEPEHDHVGRRLHLGRGRAPSSRAGTSPAAITSIPHTGNAL